MDTVIALAKQETLLAMYASVKRMNAALSAGDEEDYRVEYLLQQSLRHNFEELLEAE